MYNKLITIVLALLAIACNNDKPISYATVPVIPIDPPTSVEVDSWTPSHEYLIEPIIKSIEIQSKERLPFDEPRTEYGQEDGKLRPNWYHAYMRGKVTYIYNHDKYAVLVKDNAPFVPQVCADFIVDTIDRAAGTWFRPSRKNPGKTIGNINFRKMVHDDGLYPRRVSDLVTYFHSHPDDFDFVFEGMGEYIGNERNIKEFLRTQEARIGDLIFIKGKVPWDPKRDHSHSFFVTGFDEEGFVEHVTGNPVFPVKRRIRIEGARSPKRQVTHIIRFTRKFLEELRN